MSKNYQTQHKLNKGDTVEIFENFRNKSGFEGQAKLLQHRTTMFDGIERWLVRFDNGDEVVRFVDPQ